MAKRELSVGVKNILARYQSGAGNIVGKAAFGKLTSLSNADPGEASFEVGEEFTMPSAEELQDCCVIRHFNGRDIAAFAIDTNMGSKLLYVSSLRKSVPEYEQVGSEFKPVREGSRAKVHDSGTKLRKDIMKCGTIAQVANLLADKKIKVTGISEPITTARFQRVTNPATGNETNEIVGLRETTITSFDYAE